MAEFEKETDPVRPDVEKSKSTGGGIGIVDVLRIIVGLLLLSSLGSYLVTGNYFWNYNPWWARPNALTARLRSPVVLTDDQLLAFSGQDESLPIYLALNGTIYNVTSGRRIYGPGGPYGGFAGRDATRAYVTGCFEDDSVADLRGVEWTFIPTDVAHFSDQASEHLSEAKRNYRYDMVEAGLAEMDKQIQHWAKVFRGETGKDYWEVGYVSRKKNWMDTLPIRPLCSPAEKRRPKPRFDPEQSYAGGGWRARQVEKQELISAKLTNSPTREGHDEI